ncbi:GL24238 [Drosophila persimilis]|uniref:Twinfilin n=1 Tax=Drosophila persimilis TaxID=7234 RepID=B4G4T8_DROPE|nr:twinfilin [Drosophila persimilis]EDW24604.1 GL24238 [Drosophila persimilis]
MSHQTGIRANEQLAKVLGKAKNGKLRVVKVSIENEQLSCSATADVKKDWERDYDKLLGPLLEETVPCYILYRLDAKIPLGHSWLLISWIPDTASIRQKMVYASTKATLKTEFGSAYITEELHATTLEETTLEGYRKHKRDFAAPAPLTTREEELKELRKTEVHTEISTNTRHQTLGGISCPLTDATVASVQDLVRGNYDYLQFRIDLEEERIHVSHAAQVELSALPKQVPEDHARYHLFLFRHTHEGDYQESYVFVYSMPGYTCSVRERMMYSSCKAPFLEQLAALGVDVVKKLEIDNGNELTEAYLLDELHPKKILHRPAFAKPKGPPNRGAKRLTRPSNEDQV